MDTSALASTLVSMNAAARGDFMALAMVKQAHEAQQMVVDLLAQAAQAGKSLLPPGVGETLDRSA